MLILGQTYSWNYAHLALFMDYLYNDSIIYKTKDKKLITPNFTLSNPAGPLDL